MDKGRPGKCPRLKGQDMKDAEVMNHGTSDLNGNIRASPGFRIIDLLKPAESLPVWVKAAAAADDSQADNITAGTSADPSEGAPSGCTVKPRRRPRKGVPRRFIAPGTE